MMLTQSYFLYHVLMLESCYFVKSTLSSLRRFLTTEGPSKMMKNAFYFTLKLFSFSRCLSFSLHFLVMYKSGLIRKIRLISKFKMSEPGSQTIAIHILANILRSKGNQAMKFTQLIKYNMRTIFLEKSF